MSLSPIPFDQWTPGVRRRFEELQIREVWCFSLPLRIRFRGVETREGLLLRGPAGWGEFAPFSEYSPEESATWLASAIDSATQASPPPVRAEVPVNSIIPVVAPERAAQLAIEAGCSTAKVKVADPRSSVQEDLDRVAAVADALLARFGDRARLRVDANGAWSADEACRNIDSLNEAAGQLVSGVTGSAGLEYVEQPCPTVPELAYVRKRSAAKIAADESIRRAADPLLVSEAGAADIAVVKVAPLGGVNAALDLAGRLDMPIVVSSAVDSAIGLAAGVKLAAALPQLEHACGLGTGRLLAEDVLPTIVPEGGVIPVELAVRSSSPDLVPGFVPTGTAPVEHWVERTERTIACLTSQP